METITLDLTEMANGGYALGRASRGRTVFVPFAIPGEKIRTDIHTEKNKIAYGRLQKLLKASPDRTDPRCPHFGVCGGCHFQHMTYAAQLQTKQDVVQDQLERIGSIKNAPVQPTLPNPDPWAYQHEVELSPTDGGGLGFWSAVEKRVIPIDICFISRPELIGLLEDVDLELPGLRKLTLRIGDDDALLAAVEVDGVEPPQLEADFPISAAIVLPDNTAVNLVGDNFTLQTTKDRDFRVSAGCYLQPSPGGADLLVDTVLGYAALQGEETVLELYSGVGTLTAFLAEAAASVTAVEQNPDAVADMAINLDTDNVSVYQGSVEEILPQLSLQPAVAVLHPPKAGLSRTAVKQLLAKEPGRVVYASEDIATFARDGRQFEEAGYKLIEIQPIDMRPQTFHADVVGMWTK